MFRSSSAIDFGEPERILIAMFAFLAITTSGCYRNSGSSYKINGLATNSQASQQPSGSQPIRSAQAVVALDSQAASTGSNSTAATSSREHGNKNVRVFLNDLRDQAKAENQGEVTDAQLHKNLTLLLLACEPDIRARILVQYLRNVLTAEQKEQALAIAIAEDHKFLKLKRRRAEILEQALDGQNIEPELRKIYVETVETSRIVRAAVHNRVLTEQQLKDLAARKTSVAEEKSASNKEDAETQDTIIR